MFFVVFYLTKIYYHNLCNFNLLKMFTHTLNVEIKNTNITITCLGYVKIIKVTVTYPRHVYVKI